MEVEPAHVVIGTAGLTAAEVVSVARHGAQVTVGDDAGEALARSAAIVDDLAATGEPVYGVSTGFGFARHRLHPGRAPPAAPAVPRSAPTLPAWALPVEDEVVKAMVLLRARSLAMGYSGSRPVVAEVARRPPERRHHPGGAGARLGGVQRRPRPALPRRAGPHRRGRRRRRGRTPRREALADAGIEPLSSSPRRGWPSSTAPTACSGCSSWPSRTCASCCAPPTSARR